MEKNLVSNNIFVRNNPKLKKTSTKSEEKVRLDIHQETTIKPQEKMLNSSQKRLNQPSVLSRIIETPIYKSHISSVKEKRSSFPNNIDNDNSENSSKQQPVSIYDRRVSLPLTPRPANSLRNKNSHVEVEILRSSSATDIPAHPVISFQRLPSFASIVLMGLENSGKSSTINAILNQEVAQTTKTPSPHMHEYISHVKIPESADFYTLRIIDCPGFTNSNNNGQDASFLTTLLSYLDSKDGLRGRIPSLVLVVIKFDAVITKGNDNKDLINLLKVINHFQRHFNNIKVPNFIFVLTHFKSANQADQQNPYVKCQKLKSLVEIHTSLSQPVAIVCADNKGLLNKRNNDFVEILNEEHYPNNLIERMKAILTRKGRDSIGETIIRTAFGVEYPHSIVVKERNEIKLLDENHPTVLNMSKTLEQIYANIEWTELSILLQVGWENIDMKFRKRYPSALLTVQRTLQINKLKEFQDLPDNSKDILELLKDLPQNFAVADLLTHTLQFKIPECPLSKYIGLGYDVRKDTCLDFSPFDFSENMVNTPLGLVSHEIECNLTNDRNIVFKFFNTYQEYVVERLRDLKLRSYIFPDVSAPNNSNRKGYNTLKLNQQEISKATVAAVIEYHICRFELQERSIPEFKGPFWEAATNLSPIDATDPENVNSWKGFFGFWGTHCIQSGYAGGSIEVTLKGSILSTLRSYLNRTDLFPSDTDDISRIFQWITGDGLEFAANGINEVKTNFIKGQDVTAAFRGGADKFQNVDITKVPYDMVSELRNEWKESLTENSIFLETYLTLVPLSQYVRYKCPETAAKMDVAFQYIFSHYISQEGKSSCSIL